MAGPGSERAIRVDVEIGREITGNAGVLPGKGAIDDKPSTDQDDIRGAKNYVLAALDESMAGKPVSTASTTPYGCSVKYK